MNFTTRIFTWIYGKYVGTDMFGNCYYEAKFGRTRPGSDHQKKRWVLYKGIPEPTKVPPLWHRWLHYVTDEVPATLEETYSWQKSPLPNLTGTTHAYYPPGHMKREGKRQKATGDYEPWIPPSS